MNNRITVTLLLLGCLFFNIKFVNAQQKIVVDKLTGPIEFDGSPFESAWDQIDTVPMTMFQPVFNGKQTNRTQIMIAFDDNYLWIGGRLFTKDPSTISVLSKKRDEDNLSSDFMGVVLDSYNDNENALGFFTTPAGLRLDLTIKNDAQRSGGGPNSMPYNATWNTFWDVETTQDENGWYTEIRIPLSSLRFQVENNSTTMGVILWRWSAAYSESVTYPAVDPKYGILARYKPSIAQDIIFNGLESKKPIYFAPYVLGGYSQNPILNEAGDAYIPNNQTTKEIGADLKISITSNLNLDLTYNTDFAQVEADDQRVNLTRYSLFFPEKRLFFQERASIFSFALGQQDDLFYSRNIGLSSSGEPTKIYGGARLVGRIGKWDLGFMNMQTASNGNISSENFGVLRLRKQVINPNSYIGGIVTSRLGQEGKYNVAYGLDGIIRIFGDDYIVMKWAQTFDDDIKSNTFSMNPSYFNINWDRRSRQGFYYNVGYTYSGEEFNPGIGFQRRDQYQSYNARLIYGWLPQSPDSWLFSHSIFLRADGYYRLSDGKLDSFFGGPGWTFETRKNLNANIFLFLRRDNLDRQFNLSGNAYVPIGIYDYVDAQIRINTPESNKISSQLELRGGQYYDGTRFSIQLEPFFNVSPSLQLSGSYQYSAISFNERNQNFNNHIARIKAQYMYNTKLSASAYIQYNTANSLMLGNFRIRYNPREGNDLYLVFNEARNLDTSIEIPELPVISNRTIMIKYTYTFIL